MKCLYSSDVIVTAFYLFSLIFSTRASKWIRRDLTCPIHNTQVLFNLCATNPPSWSFGGFCVLLLMNVIGLNVFNEQTP